MGFGDPDHHHPLILHHLDEESPLANCFRCELPIKNVDLCYMCTRCNHFVHWVCFGVPDNMTHPLHPQHTLTLFPSPTSQITDNCNNCLQPFLGGYTYSCQECLKFSLHLKCFVTLNLETKHHHPLSLCKGEIIYEKDCRICGLSVDHSDRYAFACKDCNFFIHLDCTFLPQKVKHRHVHELTFQYNFPEKSKIFDCDVCLDEKELDRTLSYYYCERCDYISHVPCVTSRPEKLTTQFDHFIHEHPMIYIGLPNHEELSCDACKNDDFWDAFYFCTICNYAIHKSCARYPRLIKHPRHKENHNLSLQSSASHTKDCGLVYCELCTKKLEGNGWMLHCSDCDYAVHFFCARQFEHPLYTDKILYFSPCEETKFRCNACGGLGDGFRMSDRAWPATVIDLHLECFALPGKIDHGCHSHTLYLVTSPTEIELYLPSVFQCDICHTEADPALWVYFCETCKYIAHLKCVVSDLIPAPGQSSDVSDLCCIAMSEKEEFRVSAKLVDCSDLLNLRSHVPVFLPRGFFDDPKPPIGDHKGQPITSDETDLDKSFMDVLQCPKCKQLISAQAYSSVYDWIHRNLKASIYNMQIETPADHESLCMLDEKVVDELYCSICNLIIFPPTYSCADCQILFHKSCAELPRKYAAVNGHTYILQLPSLKSDRSTNCSRCECPFKGYAYFCVSCETGFDVTCALGAPLLKLENQKHNLYASILWTINPPFPCRACGQNFPDSNIVFFCGAPRCGLSLHFKCALLPTLVKVERRIHHHPLVLEPHLDLSVDDYFCDVCEKELNPCIWVYRCSDSCGDRATFHVSCIVTSNKKCHFVYDGECSYQHLDEQWMTEALTFGLLKQKMGVPALAAALVNEPPKEQERLLEMNLLLYVDELEHEYASPVTTKLIAEMDQAEVLHLMEFPDVLRAKVAGTMKELSSILPVADNENVEEENDGNEVGADDEEKEDEDCQKL